MAEQAENSKVADTSTQTNTPEPLHSFKVVFDGGRSYKIIGSEGGVVPSELKDMWTSVYMAEKAIAAYVEKRDAPKRTYRPTKPKGSLSGRSKNKS